MMLVDTGSIFQGDGWEKRTIRPFDRPWGRVYCRDGTYDQYVVKEIAKAYGNMDVEGYKVLDIGANIGAYTIFALSCRAAHVVAVEPEPGNWAMLQKNLWELTPRAPDGKTPLLVTGIPGALVDDYIKEEGLTTKIYLSKTGLNPGNTTMYPTRGRAEIETDVVSLYHLWAKHGPFHRIKFDCEGAAGGGPGGVDRRGVAKRRRDGRAARGICAGRGQFAGAGAVRLVRSHRHRDSGGGGAAQTVDPRDPSTAAA